MSKNHLLEGLVYINIEICFFQLELESMDPWFKETNLRIASGFSHV